MFNSIVREKERRGEERRGTKKFSSADEHAYVVASPLVIGTSAFSWNTSRKEIRAEGARPSLGIPKGHTHAACRVGIADDGQLRNDS